MSFTRLSVAHRLYANFGVLVLLLLGLTALSLVKVSTIRTALTDNSTEHSQIQRFAINFRGSAHDRAIAIRDVVLAPASDDRAKEVSTIDQLARFYAQPAAPLEAMIAKSSDATRLREMYGAIKVIEDRAVDATRRVAALEAAGESERAQNAALVEESAAAAASLRAQAQELLESVSAFKLADRETADAGLSFAHAAAGAARAQPLPSARLQLVATHA
ncbi:hypothetical protein [Ramlibacter rhizophilus]|uniref:hypothetical protein n=1 Tax=Ramlibacter rhizophilus TaxID=1781167 RepID=UPI0014324771|nr:hypothetical protein [Ramlibacter rhizophilus]